MVDPGLDVLSVLFEYKGSKKELILSRSSICDRIQGELACLGIPDSVVAPYDQLPAGEGNHFILQRWAIRWSSFVNVQSVDEVHDEDRLTVVRKPSYSPTKKEVQPANEKVENILSKVAKPTVAEAKALAKFFPSKTSTTKGDEKPLSFDPSASCVVLSQQKKRKAAFKPKHQRLVNVSVAMLKKYSPIVPKGKVRQRLAAEGKILNVKFFREMTADDVKSKILGAFQVSEYTVLECDSSGHNLVLCSDQSIDGVAVVQRRGCLYLCEMFQESRDSPQPSTSYTSPSGYDWQFQSSGSDFESVTSEHKKGKKRVSLKLKRPSAPIINISSTSSSEEDQLLDSKKARHEYIVQSRKIVEDQDRAYAESLKMDIAKDEAKAENERREQLRDRLRSKWNKDTLHTSGGVRFWIRFPDSEKVDCCIASCASTQNLYEIAYAFGNMMTPFSIFTMHPRTRVAEDSFVRDVSGVSTILVVEHDESAFDPLVIFNETTPDQTKDVVKQKSGASTDAIAVNKIVQEVDGMRKKFMCETLHTHHGSPRPIKRECIYEDVIETYQENLTDILEEYPFRIRYEDERAIDTGGVCRDMFSTFWEDACMKHFDGEQLLVPAIHPNTDMASFPILGTILSQGFMVSGFLPVRIAFPVVAASFLGPDIQISDEVLLESLVDYLTTYESSILRDAIQTSVDASYSSCTKARLIDILSRLGCREIPSPSNIKRLVVSIARHIFIGKPLGALYALHSGVPKPYHAFFQQLSIENLFNVYKTLNATPSAVLRLIEEPFDMNAAEERVFGYLLSLIGGMKQNELRLLLRFVTGSSVLIVKRIKVSFNNLSGFARRPTSHTCDCHIELPVSYSTYPEFESEFTKILTSDVSWGWAMDAV